MDTPLKGEMLYFWPFRFRTVCVIPLHPFAARVVCPLDWPFVYGSSVRRLGAVCIGEGESIVLHRGHHGSSDLFPRFECPVLAFTLEQPVHSFHGACRRRPVQYRFRAAVELPDFTWNHERPELPFSLFLFFDLVCVYLAHPGRLREWQL